MKYGVRDMEKFQRLQGGKAAARFRLMHHARSTVSTQSTRSAESTSRGHGAHTSIEDVCKCPCPAAGTSLNGCPRWRDQWEAGHTGGLHVDPQFNLCAAGGSFDRGAVSHHRKRADAAAAAAAPRPEPVAPARAAERRPGSTCARPDRAGSMGACNMGPLGRVNCSALVCAAPFRACAPAAKSSDDVWAGIDPRTGSPRRW